MMQTDYNTHWDEKFREREWGRYPPEDLVRFMGRNYASTEHAKIEVLEVGCGPGANLWFLHREGYRVHGIDASATAISKAAERIKKENSGINSTPPDLRAGDFTQLPWPENTFDLVIDIFALYANPVSVIQKSVDEIYRVLKPGGRLYSKFWGRNTTGFGEGDRVEEGTFTNIPVGPCKGMGLSHFFSENEIDKLFTKFSGPIVDTATRTDKVHNLMIEEYLCQFSKP